jgi:co-chaperonin GroES (HSP10)
VKNETGLTLTGERVLVLPPSKKEVSKGGLIIPEISQERNQRAETTGIFIACGPEALLRKEMKGLKVGDTLFYPQYAGDGVSFLKSGKQYRIINAADVLGKLDGEFDSPFAPAQTHAEAGQINELA